MVIVISSNFSQFSPLFAIYQFLIHQHGIFFSSSDSTVTVYVSYSFLQSSVIMQNNCPMNFFFLLKLLTLKMFCFVQKDSKKALLTAFCEKFVIFVLIAFHASPIDHCSVEFSRLQFLILGLFRPWS